MQCKGEPYVRWSSHSFLFVSPLSGLEGGHLSSPLESSRLIRSRCQILHRLSSESSPTEFERSEFYFCHSQYAYMLKKGVGLA
jgi:hypothetical protein